MNSTLNFYNSKNRPVNTNRTLPAIIVAAVVLITTGCAKQELRQETVDSRKLMTADLPTYQPGEYFIYDNGNAHIVASRTDAMVAWDYGNGATSTGYDNFLIPQISWESSSNKGKSITNASSTFLWPLNIGSSGRFNITQSVTENKTGVTEEIQRSWECDVVGTENVTVPVGNFDTYVISCDRYSVNGNEWRGRRTYYYSPDIRHYVMLEKDYANRPSSVVRLTEYGFNSEYLPKEDLDKLRSQFYLTLGKGEKGAAEILNSSSDQISAMIIPYQSFKGPQGQQCREYRSVYNVGGRVHQHTRKACATKDGSWQRLNQ